MQEEKYKYTFIMEYRGGTYVSQIVSNKENMQDVCIEWAETLDVTEIQHIGQKMKKKLIKEMKDEDNTPALLKGLENVWFTHTLLKGKGVYINIVKTYSGDI